jgi:hypothetical protein
LVQQVRAGSTVSCTLVAANPLLRGEQRTLVLEGSGVTSDQTISVSIPAGGETKQPVTLRLADRITAGRHILPVRGAGGADTFVVLDVAE